MLLALGLAVTGGLVIAHANDDPAGSACADRRVALRVEGVGAVPGAEMRIDVGLRQVRLRADASSDLSVPPQVGSGTPAVAMIGESGLPPLEVVSWALGRRTRGSRVSPFWQRPHGMLSARETPEGLPEWRVSWPPGRRLVKVSIGGAPETAMHPVRVIDMSSCAEYRARDDGVTFALVDDGRTEAVMLVPANAPPAAVSAAKLVVGPLAPALAVRVDLVGVGVSSAIRVEFPPTGPTVRRASVQAWAWDSATGALLREGVFDDARREFRFENLAQAPVEVVVQGVDGEGLAWMGTWKGVAGTDSGTVRLSPSDFVYRRHEWTGVVLESRDARSAPVRWTVVPESGTNPEPMEARNQGGLLPLLAGTYVARGSRAQGAKSTEVRCRVRQGVLCVVIL